MLSYSGEVLLAALLGWPLFTGNSAFCSVDVANIVTSVCGPFLTLQRIGGREAQTKEET